MPGLESLRNIGDDLGVTFTLTGSVCRRILLARAFPRSLAAESLFDLAPYTSDIDLIHSGAEEHTVIVERAIADRVPFSEAFRWQIFSESKFSKYDRFLRTYAHHFPGMYLRLDDNGFYDPLKAEEAYRARELPFYVNPKYGEFEKSGVSIDNELFSVLLYLRSVADVQGYLGSYSLDSLFDDRQFKNIADVVDRGTSKLLQVTITSLPYITARLSYLLWDFAASCSSFETWDSLISASGLKQTLRFLSTSPTYVSIVEMARSIGEAGPGGVVSSRISDSQFRISPTPYFWIAGDDAKFAYREHFNTVAFNGDEVILSSGKILVNDGFATCSEFASTTREFLYFAIRIDSALATVLADIEEADLSVGIIVPSDRNHDLPDGATIALPVVISFRYGSRAEGSMLLIRLSVYGLLEHLPAICSLLKIDEPFLEVVLLKASADTRLQGGSKVTVIYTPRVPTLP